MILDDSAYCTAQQASDYLGISKYTIFQWFHMGIVAGEQDPKNQHVRLLWSSVRSVTVRAHATMSKHRIPYGKRRL